MSDTTDDGTPVVETDESTDESAWPEAARKTIDKIRKDAQRQRAWLDPLPEGDREAIKGFASALARGDGDAAVDWLAGNLAGLAGDGLVEVMQRYGFTKAEAKQAAKMEADPNVDDIDLDEYILERVERKLVEERQREATRRANEESAKSFDEIERALHDLKIDPTSEEAERVMDATKHIVKAQGETRSFRELIQLGYEFEQDRKEIVAARKARERSGNGTGSPPQGAPVNETIEETPAERIAATKRLLDARKSQR